MFALCASRYAAPVKFTLFCATRNLYRRFVPQMQPRRSLVNPLKFKWLARVKFVNLVLPKPPFQLGFVGTGRAGVVANHAVNVEDASAASERLCAFIRLV